MKENAKDKSLVKVNENSIFYKIKIFFRNLFNKEHDENKPNNEENNIESLSENDRVSFVKSLKNIENEETKLLKLQKKYRNGEIKEQELTEEQTNSLCLLYDKQIAELKKSNEIRKQKHLEYRKKLT